MYTRNEIYDIKSDKYLNICNWLYNRYKTGNHVIVVKRGKKTKYSILCDLFFERYIINMYKEMPDNIIICSIK